MLKIWLNYDKRLDDYWFEKIMCLDTWLVLYRGKRGEPFDAIKMAQYIGEKFTVCYNGEESDQVFVITSVHPYRNGGRHIFTFEAVDAYD